MSEIAQSNSTPRRQGGFVSQIGDRPCTAGRRLFPRRFLKPIPITFSRQGFLTKEGAFAFLERIGFQEDFSRFPNNQIFSRKIKNRDRIRFASVIPQYGSKTEHFRIQFFWVEGV